MCKIESIDIILILVITYTECAYNLQKIFLQYGARLLRKEFYSKENEETEKCKKDNSIKGIGSVYLRLIAIFKFILSNFISIEN